MKRISFHWLAAAVAVVVLGTSPAWARDVLFTGYLGEEEAEAAVVEADDDCYCGCVTCDDCCDVGCCDVGCCDGCGCGCGCGCGGGLCGGCCGAIVFDAELLFFKYQRAGGTRVGDAAGERVFGDHEVAPRLTAGYIFGNGLGFRARYFEWDHLQSTLNANPIEYLDVDTYNIDLEVFEKFQVNRNWMVEISAGVRYNEFRETLRDQDEFRIHDFDGWGGIVGLEATRSLGRWGGLYARARGALMEGDKFVQNEDGGNQILETDFIDDSTQGMTELAIGYEISRYFGRSLVTFRGGYEWQNWFNYSSAFVGPVNPHAAAGDSPEEVFVGPADVGFNGWTLMLGIEY
jgi:hypothetical protein